MSRIKAFVKRHAIRLYALAVAVVALASDLVPSLAEYQGKILELVSIGIVLMGGELAQRVEDRKTRNGH